MRINKSIVLTALVPSAREDESAFIRAIDRLHAAGVNTIEYAAPLTDAPRRGELLAQRGLGGIFLAATFQKEQGQNLSAVDREERRYALEACKSCVDAAILSGAKGVLITSGRYPEDTSLEPDAWQAFEESLRALLDHAGGRIRLLLEPGDRTVDARQLAGPTAQVLKMMRRLNQPLTALGLTMDTSHLAQLAEDPHHSLKESMTWCDHVHLANCVLDQASPLYGDKHPAFDHQGAVYTSRQLQETVAFLKDLAPHPKLTLAVEIISRETAPFQMLEQVLMDEAWFFKLA